MITDMKQKENVDIDTLKLIHKTLDEILTKWMSIISKTFRNDIFTEYDMKPDKHVNKKKKNKKKSNTKKGTKKDTKLDIKHDIVRLDNKPKTNEPQKTFINNESHLKKMINPIKRILEYFVCEKFINEKFHTLRVSKDMILLHSRYATVKGFKEICKIDICRDIISLNIKRNHVDNSKEDITICIDGERITLKVSQTENHQGNHSKKINICI